LLSVVFTVILPGKHRAFERFHARRQVNTVLAQVPASLGGVVAHAVFIVYTIMWLSRRGWGRGGHAVQAETASRHGLTRAMGSAPTDQANTRTEAIASSRLQQVHSANSR